MSFMHQVGTGVCERSNILVYTGSVGDPCYGYRRHLLNSLQGTSLGYFRMWLQQTATGILKPEPPRCQEGTAQSKVVELPMVT